VSAGAGPNAADTKSVPVNEDESASTAAEIRALAEQAEAEAAEAEALAAAARARARAIQLRRQAERIEATEEHEATEEAEAAEEAEAHAKEPVESEAQDLESEESGDTRSEDGAESVETEESSDDAVGERDSDISSADEAAEKPTRFRRWRRRPRWSTIAAVFAVIVILVALSLSVIMVLQHRDASRQRQRAAEFAAAARQGVVTLTSLDFNNAKQGVQRIVDDSTGVFRDDFLKMADDFTKVVEQSKVVEQGTVQATAVDLDTMTNDSAVVLVVSTSEVTNAAGAKQDPRNFRLIVTITRDGDQLKMSKVEFVP
jgi:Mce-associated membrane protein